EGDRMTVEVSLQMDLGRKAAARTAECLAFLPPFAPAAETWARTMVLSNICTRWAEADSEARWSKKISNTPALLNRSNRFHSNHPLRAAGASGSSYVWRSTRGGFRCPIW